MASLPDRRPPPVYVADPSLLGSAVTAPPPARGFPAVAAWPLWRYAFIAICVGALCGTAAMYLVSLTNNLSVDGDNAVYITLAKSLATGHGYTDIQGPTPRIEAQYPFLFPLFLTPIVGIWGAGAVLFMELLVIGFALAALIWCFFLFRQWLDSAPLALVVTMAAGSSELFWEYSHKVLTEIPYLFFTVAACWFVDIYAKQDRAYTKAGLIAALATGAAFLTRTIGLSLCLALPLYLLLAAPIPGTRAAWRKRVAKVLLVGTVLLITAGGWTLRNRLVFSGEGHNYMGQFLLKQAYVPEAGQVSTGDLWPRVGENITYYAEQFQRMVLGTGWDGVYIVGSIALPLLWVTFGGFVYSLIRRRSLAEPYLVFYVAVVLLWPWKDMRFAVPVLPFLFYYLAQAFRFLASLPWVLRRLDPRLVAACILIPFGGRPGLQTLHTALSERHVGYHYEAGLLGEWPAYADWRDFHAAAAWLKTHAPAGSTVVNRSPNLLYLWAGLPSRNYPYSFDKNAMLKDLTAEHHDYVVYDDFNWTYTTKLYLRPVISRYPAYFRPVARFNAAVVYLVVKPA
jgi:hypothetical protein